MNRTWDLMPEEELSAQVIKILDIFDLNMAKFSLIKSGHIKHMFVFDRKY